MVPSAGRAPDERSVPHPDAGSRSTLLLSIGAGVSIGVAMVGLEVVVLKQYGLALFLGTPFIMGAVTAFVWNRRYPTSNRTTAQTTILMFLTASGALFFIGAEGVVWHRSRRSSLLRVFQRRIHRTDHCVGAWSPARVQRDEFPATTAGTEPVLECFTATSTRVPPVAARRVSADGTGGRTDTARGKHVVRAGNGAGGLLAVLHRLPHSRDSWARSRAHQRRS